MNASDFINELRGDALSGVYLLHGEDEFIKDSAVQAALRSVDEAARDLNTTILESVDMSALLDACAMLPFFSERRLVLCKALPTAADWERLAAFLPTLPPSTLLLFMIRGNAPGTMDIVKTLKKQGRLVECRTLTEPEAVKWVLKQASLRKSLITSDAARFLVQLVGCPLNELNNEFCKAASYAGAGKEITREVISIAVTRNIEYEVFSMVDYFLAGKASDGLRVLEFLLQTNSAFSIAGLMASRFKQMLQARLYMDKGMDRKAVIAKLGGSPYAAGKAYDAAKRYTAAQLEQNVIAFSDVGYMQVSGRMKDTEALEQAVLRCVPKGKC